MTAPRGFMSRRGFLAHAGAGFMVLSTGATTACNVLFSPDVRSVATALIELLHRHDQARELGQAFLEANDPSGQQSLESMTRTLLDSLGIDLDEVTLLPVANLVSALAGRVREDFAAGTTAAVDGWLLSQAEARVCAILYLSEG